jgi:hypothetical protein
MSLFLFPIPTFLSTQKVKIKESFTGLPGVATNFFLLLSARILRTIYIFFKFNNNHTGISANSSGSGSGKGRGVAD